MKRRANGEGTVRQRADGRWEGVISTGDGRRKSVYGRKQSEVLAKMDVAENARAAGLPQANERQTVAEYLATWLEGRRSQLRPATWQRYEISVRKDAVPGIGRTPLVKLSPAQLQALYAGRLAAGSAPQTVKNLHAVLHRALHDALRWGMVVRNVAALVDAPRVELHDMTTLTAPQVSQLLAAAAGDRLEALYTLAVTTGMRQGELLALRWRDVDLDRGAVHVRRSVQWPKGGYVFTAPKTKKSQRQVTIGKTSVAALRRHRTRQLEERLGAAGVWEDLDLVFANGLGRPIEPQNLVQRAFYPLLERAGLPRIRFHDLRHTAATLLLARGVHPKKVSEMLGHATVAITLDRYSHVTPTMHEEAAEILESVVGGAR